MVARRIRIGPSYTGPGDIVSGWAAWWGLRAYTAASIGGNLIKLRRDNDNATQDFVSLADGSLDVASIATFKGANNLFVHTVYDQAGTNHATQTNGGDQPSFTLSAVGALPSIGSPSDTTQAMNLTSNITQAQPFLISAVVNFPGTGGVKNYLMDVGDTCGAGRDNANTRTQAGATPTTAIANGWHRVQTTFNGASSEVYVDGSGTTINPSTGGWSNSQVILHFYWNDFMGEVSYRNGTLTSQQKASLDSNQQTYWGI